MKFLRKVASYTRGVRLAMLALAVMMTVALLMGILVVSQVRFIRHNYDVVNAATGDLDRLYYFMRMEPDFTGEATPNLLEQLKTHPALEHIYLVYGSGSVSYTVDGEKEYISIQLMDPKLPELFPAMGIDFGAEGGTILATSKFPEVKIGDDFEVSFTTTNRTEVFTAVGRIAYPYRTISMNGGSTRATVNEMFGSGQCLLLPATEENLAKLADAYRVRPGDSFLVEVKEGATSEQVEDLLLDLSRAGVTNALPQMLERTEEAMDQQLRDLLPMPLFLFAVSAFAYFSTMILIFMKKEQDLAICYLCGGKRWDCMRIVMGAFSLVILGPVLLALGAVKLLPVFDWLQAMTIINYLIDEWTYGMLWGFLILTQLIAGVAAWLEMKDHTPLTLLRGVEK